MSGADGTCEAGADDTDEIGSVIFIPLLCTIPRNLDFVLKMKDGHEGFKE